MLGAQVRLCTCGACDKARVRCLPNPDAAVAQSRNSPRHRTALHTIENNILGVLTTLQLRNPSRGTTLPPRERCLPRLPLECRLLHPKNDVVVATYVACSLCLQRDQPLFCLGHPLQVLLWASIRSCCALETSSCAFDTLLRALSKN